jgi:hypothetical protein
MDHDQHQTINPRAKIKPLTSRKADGTAYEREDNVLDCIALYQGVPESVRIAAVPKMPSEAQTYFIRNTARKSRAFYDLLFQQLTRRSAHVIHETIRGVDKFDANDLSIQILSRVMQLIVNPKPSPTADLLEIRFAQAVETIAVDALRVYMRSPLGALRGRPAAQLDDEGDEMERPLEAFLTGAPGPEDLLLVLRGQGRRHELLRKACRAVTDRRYLKAAILRWGYDWPISSKNPNERSLSRHFGVSEKQIDRWLASAMTAMRAALASEPEMIEAQAQRLLEAIEVEIRTAEAVEGGAQ